MVCAKRFAKILTMDNVKINTFKYADLMYFFSGKPKRLYWLIAILTIFILLSVISYAFEESAKKIDIANALSPPGTKAILGTDQLGRDVFARILVGTKTVLLIGILSAFLAETIGLLFAIIISSFDNLLENIFSFLCDTILCFPSFFLIITIVGLIGRSFECIVIVIGITQSIYIGKILKNEIKVIKTRTFIESAAALGASKFNIFTKHIFPNILSTLLILGANVFSQSILIESSMSFIGIGLPDDLPSYGNLIAQGWDQIISVHGAWWLAFFPGLLLIILTITISFIAEEIAEYLEPTIKK